MAHTERLGQLRENLVEYFSQEELRSLCFDLGVDWDRLRGEEKAGKVTALLTSLDNTGRVPELIERCSKLRPNVAWQEILRAAEAPSPFKGLQYFDEADADLFFGRELLTAKLVSHLAPHPPLLPGEGAQRERSDSSPSSAHRAAANPLLYGPGLSLPSSAASHSPMAHLRQKAAALAVHLITPTHTHSNNLPPASRVIPNP